VSDQTPSNTPMDGQERPTGPSARRTPEGAAAMQQGAQDVAEGNPDAPAAQIIRGPAFVLGDNIDTDQIIPAEYLSYNPAIPEDRKFFGMYANSGVPPEQSGLPEGNERFVPEGEFASRYPIIIGGKNFGCGSSREHAPLALAEAGVQCVVAEFYARIFFRNSVNGGYLLPLTTAERLIETIQTGDDIEVNVTAGRLVNHTRGTTHQLESLGDVIPIIEAGGVFAYARKTGMLTT
jgi:3-isopropylmalate/(R)-2-methylmalate dehydratase small subunit